ncbi:MAG: hypothetical protein NTX64_07940, partial [Elusimicrobia bacterium]|nr:hypothetical protein [Elusimicrobiota bacterium]
GDGHCEGEGEEDGAGREGFHYAAGAALRRRTHWRMDSKIRRPSSEPSAAKELAELLQERGHLDEARGRAQATLAQILCWVRGLPRQEEAGTLADFMESMARRDF